MIKQALVILGLLILLGVIAFFSFRAIGGILGVGAPDTPDVLGDQQNDRFVDVEDIVEDPVVYRELTVEVQAPITDWVTKRAFVLGGGGGSLLVPSVGRGLLVIRPEEFQLADRGPGNALGLGEETTVYVRGRVEILYIVGLEEAWGVDLIDEVLDPYEARPVIIADVVREVTQTQ